jgi:hypothetical protein
MMSRAKLTAKDLSSGTQVKQIHHVRAKKRVQNSADQGYRFAKVGFQTDLREQT